VTHDGYAFVHKGVNRLAAAATTLRRRATSTSRLARDYISNFDSIRLIRYIKNTILNFLVDCSSGLNKCLLDILRGLCRCLHEDKSMFLCKLLAFLIAHCTPVRQITLVPDKHYRHVSIRMLPRILQPACKVVESLPPSDIVDQKSTSSASVV